MSDKTREERLLMLRRLEAQIKNGSMTDKEKESKAGRAPRGKRPYK